MEKPTILHHTVTGTGPPMVMLHGFLSSGHYFKHIRTRFARDHQVITLDLLGCGKSPKPDAPYGYDVQVAAIRQTLKYLGISGDIILLGHSMGAMVAARYAQHYPNEVAHLLLFNPPLFIDRDQATASHTATGRHYRMLLFSPRRERYWRLLRQVPRNPTDKRPAINFADTLRMTPQARSGMYENVIRKSDFFDNLTRLTPPTLLVVGTRDRAIYVENLKHLAPPDNLHVKVIDSDHHPLVRELRLSEELIRTQLERIR
jgi:pimeloyl-ACP methyl ester carboxylesterase